jgi:Delta7-sterol 5-desaturase
MMEKLFSGIDPVQLWIVVFLVTGLIAGIAAGFFRARKIQPRGFKWKTFRDEILFAIITLAFSGAILGAGATWMRANGWIVYNSNPTSWWVIALEYAAYWITFDTWFYWWHRAMHKEPMYSLVHELHHRSNAPNLLTTFSVHPFESWINGSWSFIFMALLTVHTQTGLLIAITAPIMGLYVHSGYEFFPRWWNKSWATKWFITATFHDQHHKYFNWNFGGFTPVWDYLCGTVRKNYEADFVALKDRVKAGKAGETEAVPAE